ncbi:winged helix-turn-helix transcriptional regulator [bacterium]|nr:winged helix-turn-helix transcriptional regulator [bacterium]
MKIGHSSFTGGNFKAKFLSMKESFIDEKELHYKSKMILHLLEIRSYNNNGDVKFNDQKIAEILNLSLRTVQRHVKKLEELGFISRITKRYYDIKKVKTSNKQGFYSDRIIRCFRIFLANHCEQKTKESMKWKNDFRPKINQHEYKISPRWFAREGDESGVLPMFTNLFELFALNVMSKEVYEKFYKIKDMWFDDNSEAKLILGKKAFT